MKENWKPISGYETRYKVSSTGKVYSIISGRELSRLDCRGYKFVYLYNGTKDSKTKYLIHRLVAKEFVPNPKNKPHINHLDYNRENNNYSNLEWCTPKENLIHARKDNRIKVPSGCNHSRARLNKNKVLDIRRLHNSGTTIHKLARDYEMDRKSIRNIVKNRSYKF